MAKFKVGDRVRIVHPSSVFTGHSGTVIDWSGLGCMCYVIIDGKGGCYWDVEHLEPEFKGIPLQTHIDEVMDEFDFAKVEQVMQALDWKWFGTAEGTPTQGEMRRQVRHLMKDTYERADKYDGDELYTATGGFEVTYSKKHDTFRVSFRVTDWMTNEFQSEPPF